MAQQKFTKITKYLAKGDNWKFGMDVITDIPDIDAWEKKLVIQQAVDTVPLMDINIDGNAKTYVGEMTKAQSVILDRGEYFIKITARKPNEDLRTLTDPLSRLIIF
jgi:hypothetical protein